ncbi:hypothetical protein E1287_21355 [Actinomadura sp. KC06]|uniref:hypothetical protein n=1 Tax=Actinomadura sp. KC06 TaxID=2530369 RepID=UPI001047ABE3|nr:hypothetical protein [Actinomadura sp. KC06]TDD32864.1 hypothetical protein E1287_21355 [Actinomadura sp. KC06]
MPAPPAPVDPGGAAPVQGPRLRAAGANPSVRSRPSVHVHDLPDELAVRLHALRRARRDARTRASRVRRVLLAPSAPSIPSAPVAPAETHVHL